MVITCFGRVAAKLKLVFSDFSRLSVLQLFSKLLSWPSRIRELVPSWRVTLQLIGVYVAMNPTCQNDNVSGFVLS